MKNEELFKIRESLQAERDEVLKRIAPIQTKRDKVWARLQAVQEEWKALGEEIASLETDRYREVCQQIAVISRALPGTKSLQAGA